MYQIYNIIFFYERNILSHNIISALIITLYGLITNKFIFMLLLFPFGLKFSKKIMTIQKQLISIRTKIN